jgi:hypothetical protein
VRVIAVLAEPSGDAYHALSWLVAAPSFRRVLVVELWLSTRAAARRLEFHAQVLTPPPAEVELSWKFAGEQLPTGTD